jgi:hypothetical protein
MKIDVVINVYGKPYQTLCTLKSLMKHSSKHIDKIYLIKEKEQPYDEEMDWIFSYFDNLIVYTPTKYNFITININMGNDDERYGVRYQYGFEKSDKEFIFITHNDVLYTDDIIGDMINQIGDSVGIGQIGQCWNCPAKNANLCNGDKFYEWNPTYEEVISLELPYVRTNIDNIDRYNPKPMIECRVNEWACLINRELSNKETYPNGDTSLFGTYDVDMGTLWFKSLHLKGYKFVDYRKNFIHSYWSEISNGYQTQLNKDLYDKSEENAKKYYDINFV